MSFNIKKLTEVNYALTMELRKYTYEIIGGCQQVHKELGPFLNEYIYQEALDIILKEKDIPHIKEYFFSIVFHGQKTSHKHYVDFYCKGSVFIECKAVEHLSAAHRQQLWNYMRLTKTRLGLLYNFAPIKDECERYYYVPETKQMFTF